MMRSGFRCAKLAVMAGLVSCGCSMLGYRLGTSLPRDIQVVHVPVFDNATDEPGLDADMTRATVQAFQRDGSLSVADASKADVTLLAELTNFQSSPLRYGVDSVMTGEEYRFTIEATITLVRTRTGLEILRRTVIGEVDVEIEGDMLAAKMRAMPRLADNLAYRIVTAVVEYW